MAPEQTRGGAVEARANVWSLGVVLYEMLTGRRPFTGGTGVAVVHAVLHEAPEPLARLRPEVPAELDRIVYRMLAKNPEERYADAAEVLVDLRRGLGLPTTSSLSSPAVGRPRRRPFRAAIGGLVLTLARARRPTTSSPLFRRTARRSPSAPSGRAAASSSWGPRENR